MMRFFQHHVFHLHQADLGGALVFVKLHRDVLDVRLQLRDHDVLQRVDATACLFNLCRHQLAGFFHFRQLQHFGEEAQMRDRQKERKARTRRLIQEGAILEKALPQTTQMTLEQLEVFLCEVFKPIR